MTSKLDIDSGASQPPAPQAARRPWRWSLATMLLATGTIGVWIGYWQVTRQNEQLASHIKILNRLARELTVDDPDQFAVIEQPEHWYGEDIWNVHLPAGAMYRLKLASRGIDNEGFPPPATTTDIAAGRHTIELRFDEQSDKSWRLRVLVDDAVAMELDESADWKTSGSSTSGEHTQITQQPTNHPLSLKRLRFHTPNPTGGSSSPNGLASGALLWIERANSEEIIPSDE